MDNWILVLETSNISTAIEYGVCSIGGLQLEESWPRAEGSRRPDGPSSDFFRNTFNFVPKSFLKKNLGRVLPGGLAPDYIGCFQKYGCFQK